jgi:hypothetical protein
MQVLIRVQEGLLKNILCILPMADDHEYPLSEYPAISLAQFRECPPVSAFCFGKQLVIGGLWMLHSEIYEHIGAHKVPYR